VLILHLPKAESHKPRKIAVNVNWARGQMTHDCGFWWRLSQEHAIISLVAINSGSRPKIGRLIGEVTEEQPRATSPQKGDVAFCRPKRFFAGNGPGFASQLFQLANGKREELEFQAGSDPLLAMNLCRQWSRADNIEGGCYGLDSME
jgi:hypothetical protein